MNIINEEKISLDLRAIDLRQLSENVRYIEIGTTTILFIDRKGKQEPAKDVRFNNLVNTKGWVFTRTGLAIYMIATKRRNQEMPSGETNL